MVEKRLRLGRCLELVTCKDLIQILIGASSTGTLIQLNEIRSSAMQIFNLHSTGFDFIQLKVKF